MKRNDRFVYEEAFARNLGLVSAEEQQKLRSTHVAIVGAGGMGSMHAVTLARLGVGRLTLADPDVYELVNFNRQAAALVDTLGRNKAEATAELVRRINPGAAVRVMPSAIDRDNVDDFLDGADVVLDGLDVFEIRARRRLFAAARSRSVPVVSAGPIGFGAVWFVAAPSGMSLDAYLGLDDGQGEVEQVLRFLAGIGGQGPQLRYMKASRVDSASGAAPSLGLAVQTAAGVAAAEVAKWILGRGARRPLPWMFQFDPYTHFFRRYYRPLGGRDPLFRLRLWVIARLLTNVRERVERRAKKA